MSGGVVEQLGTLTQTLESQLGDIQALARDLRGPKTTDCPADPLLAAQASPRGYTVFDSTLEIEVVLVVKGIFKLDTIAQTFAVLLGLQMTWPCPPSEDPPDPGDDDGDWEPNWTPKYRIKHQMEDMNSETIFTVKTDANSQKFVVMEADHLVTIYEQLELQSFPTDLQDLTIELESKVPAERVLWVRPASGGKPCRLMESKCFLNDFSILNECPFTYNMFCKEHDQRVVSALRLSVKVARKSTYYLLNVNVLMFIICFFSLCAWSTHPADIASRHTIDFSLILTAVMFKLVLTQMLPKVSYITTLDSYVMTSFLLLMGITVVHTALPLAFITHGDNSPLTLPSQQSAVEEDLLAADMVAFWIVFVVLVFFNAGYSVFFMYRKSIERRAFVAAALSDQEEFDGSDSERIKQRQASMKPTSV